MRFANDALRFFLELAALAAQAYWGATADTPLWPLIAVGAPLVVAGFWGRFMSPKAPRRLHDPLRLLAEIVIFGLTAVVLIDRGHAALGIALGAAAAIHLVLTFVFRQR
jgi:Protein of unknown function (DUF2568)